MHGHKGSPVTAPCGPDRATLKALAFGAASLLLGCIAHAAPLDALLSAYPERVAPNGYLEVGTDHMNGALDVFRVRDKDPLIAGTRTGDYSGLNVSGALRVRDGLWLSGSLRQRAISSGPDTHRYTSWQLAGLYRFFEPEGKLPAMAVRLTGWGNRAGAIESSTPVTVPGAILDTVKISNPEDRQLQADLIATWQLASATDVSVLLGGGSSRLSYGALSATTRRNGCGYQLAFNGNDIFGTLAGPCNATGGVIQQFYDSSGSYGVDVAKEIAWRGNFIQAGVNGAWRGDPWTFSAGYLFHAIRRVAVDDILRGRGETPLTQTHNITLEAAYRFDSRFSAFARTQLTTKTLFSDIPVIYNSSTASRLGHRYSLYTLGLRAVF